MLQTLQIMLVALLGLNICQQSWCQDNGEKAAQLKSMINGTLPNAQRFQAASTSVDTGNYFGVISSWPMVSSWKCQKGLARQCLFSSSLEYRCFVNNFSILKAFNESCLSDTRHQSSISTCQASAQSKLVVFVLRDAAHLVIVQGKAQQAGGATQTGIMKLGLSNSGRDGYVFVPQSFGPATGNAMILALHGAGKGGLDALGVLIDQANSSGGNNPRNQLHSWLV